MGNGGIHGASLAGSDGQQGVLARFALLACLVCVAGCPTGDGHRVQASHGAAGESQEYVGAGGAPPVAGTTGGSAGATAGAGVQPPPMGGTTAGMSTAGMAMVAGTGVPAGEGGTGMPPIEGRVFDAGSDPNRNNVQAGQVCARLAQIQCAGEAFCCDNPGRDRAACEETMRAGCVEEMYLDAISSNPITAFDAATAAVTFAEIERLASLCDSSIAAFGASREGLMGMFRGTEASGESCAPGLTMDRATAAAKLASCTDIATTACLPTSALSWKCAARSDVGGRCFTDVNCFDGLYCPNLDLKFSGTECSPRKPVGSPCEAPNECESLFCKGGSCVEATQQAAYCLTAQ